MLGSDFLTYFLGLESMMESFDGDETILLAELALLSMKSTHPSEPGGGFKI
jgi:hypothetical protein